VAVEEVAVLVVLVRRHRHAVRAAVRRAVDDEISSAIKEETGVLNPRRKYRGANGVAMTTDEDDPDGYFLYNHPERGAYFAA